MNLTPEQEKWLQALESGQYKQGIGRLRDEDDCFCCLGVACELFIPETMHITQGRYSGKRINYGKGADTMYGAAPRSVVDILRLRSSTGTIKDENTIKRCLAEENDRGMTFAEIAAFIRANPEKVFVQEGEYETE